MNKKMLIECDPHQIRIAILEQDRLAELFIERHHQLGVVGNIYQGRVNRVLPGMQAAFVDIGLDRDAFLYVSEVSDPLATFDQVEAREASSDEQPAPIEPDLDGERDDEQEEQEEQDDEPRERPSIDQLLKPGQELMVQVLKDALPNKGARVTTQITLPGRSLVLLPSVSHLGVSRRIEDEEERLRLRTMLEGLQPPGSGLIVRTAGEGSDREELESDLAYLQKLWQRIRRRSESVRAPTLIHRDLDVALRVVRDYLTIDYSVIWVDGEETYERLVDFVDQIKPSMLGRVKLFEQDSGLFERFAIDDEIEAALKTKAWLKSGGHIVIHPTEALIAIDVNTGRYVGRHNLEDTVLTTNLEAVQEIVRQIRLRNLGGIIVIDLIDMEEPEHRERVSQALADEMAKDRARNKVLSISEFGLVEITRKRSRPSLERLLTQPCPYCRGTGRIKSLATISLELRRQILRQRSRFQEREVLLRVHPDVARALQQENLPVLRELEQELNTDILLQSDPGLHHERFDILEV
ncbi:MAG: Rne/Rng family ribonuclease [bacterium]|nr:Rne/Rng family ribonuclease [bacterium]